MDEIKEFATVKTLYHVECYDKFGLLKWIDGFYNLVTTVGLNHLISRLAGTGVGGNAGGYHDGRRLPKAWATGTAYSIGDVVRPTAPGTNNRLFVCSIAGTSHASTEPTWPTTANGTVADNTATWLEASQFFVGLKGTGTVVLADTMASHAGWTELTPYSNSTRPACVLGTVAAGSVDNSASKAVFNINATATVAGLLLTDIGSYAVLTSGLLYGAGDFAASRSVVSGDTLTVQATLSVS